MSDKIVSPWAEQKRSRAQESARKRQAVLAMAARLFRQKGFETCTLSDIADALEVTKPTIYHYAKSKELLLVEILNAATEAMVAAFERAAESNGSGLEKLRLAMIDYAKIRVSDEGRCLSLVRDSIMSPENLAALAERGRRSHAFVYRILDAGFADGTIRPADRLILYNTVFGALNWLPRWMDEAPGLSLEVLVEKQFEMFVAGIAGPAVTR